MSRPRTQRPGYKMSFPTPWTTVAQPIVIGLIVNLTKLSNVEVSFLFYSWICMISCRQDVLNMVLSSLDHITSIQLPWKVSIMLCSWRLFTFFEVYKDIAFFVTLLMPHTHCPVKIRLLIRLTLKIFGFHLVSLL